MAKKPAPARKAAAPKKPAKAVNKKQKNGTSREAAEQRKKLFVEAYLVNGGNGRQAAIEAGYAPKAAAQQASRLLTDANISYLIKERRAKLVESMELTTERTLREIARLAYFDPRKLLDNTGRPLPLSELDDNTAAAIAGLDVEDLYSGRGEDKEQIGVVVKYKFADKNAALEKAMKHLGQYERDNKQKSLLEGVDRETVKAIVERLRGAA